MALVLRRFVVSFAVVIGMASRSWADDAPKKPWKDAGEFSLVSTNGNSKATSTSVKNTFNYDWTKAALELVAGGLGSSSGNSVTAEQYNASEKVSYPLTENKKNYVFEKGGWDKMPGQESASWGVAGACVVGLEAVVKAGT